MTSMTWYPDIGVKPYYADSSACLYLGDCREILPLLPARSVDLVVTDPPYGINYVTHMRLRSDPLVRPIEGDTAYPFDVIEQCKLLARVGVLAFARGEPMKSQSTLIWVKNDWSAGDLEHGYANQWESILWWAGEKHEWANGRPSNVLFADRVPAQQLQHPTQKPLALMRQLLMHHKAQIILDPFLGSGTTARAAKDLGRKCIGIEISEKYLEIAVKRLAQEVLPL